MNAKEFYEKYKGKYFIYDNESVRLVGYENDSEFIIVAGYSDGYYIEDRTNMYISDNLVGKKYGSLYSCSIYGKSFQNFSDDEVLKQISSIEPTTEPISKRFHAACCAMQGIVNSLMDSSEWHGWSDDYIAKRSFEIADELLKQENDGKALQ